MKVQDLIVLHNEDNVAVAMRALEADTLVDVNGQRLRDLSPVPAAHKLAVRPIAQGARVTKYRQTIGIASRDILAGAHVHVDNVGMPPQHDGEAHAYATGPRAAPADRADTFLGYMRADGQAGTRNYIGVIASVNCSATVCHAIADAFRGNALEAFKHVDGVVAITHQSGCGMSSAGDGIALLRRTLAGYARNPNFSSVLFVGLGCEVNQAEGLVEALDASRPRPVRTLVIQDEGGVREAVARGIAIVREELHAANRATRTAVPASHLKLGLQCGGSDGYSSMTANPALGVEGDLLVRSGGTAILSETPEIYGAEHLLTARAVSGEVAQRLMDKLHWWEGYTEQNGGEMSNN